MNDRSTRTALIAVVNGQVYEDYATALFKSAHKHFTPTYEVECLMLPGKSGWPAATMYRHHTVLEHWSAIKQRYGYVYLVDADMMFSSRVGSEVRPPYAGVTAVLHPGYVGTHHSELPYERRPESACYVDSEDGEDNVYYAGGFVGGDAIGYHWLASMIASRIDKDVREGRTPRYHDESALNAVLAQNPPQVTLDPSYCHPDDDSYYKTFWPKPYPRRLVALDKAAHERVGR